MNAEPIECAGGWYSFSPTLGVFRAVTIHGRVSHHASAACAVEALALAAAAARAA